MPPKKHLPPRLSDYLLEKAAPFEFYPKRMYGLSPEIRKIFSDLSRDLVEWRKTFQPKGDNRRLDFHAKPAMLDQFYSKELLAAVPGFVQVLLQPRAVEVVGADKLGEFAKTVGSKAEVKPNGIAEIWINASEQSRAQATMLSSLGEVIAAGWKAKLQATTLPTESAT